MKTPTKEMAETEVPEKPRRSMRPVIKAVNACDAALDELDDEDVRRALWMLLDIYEVPAAISDTRSRHDDTNGNTVPSL